MELCKINEILDEAPRNWLDALDITLNNSNASWYSYYNNYAALINFIIKGINDGKVQRNQVVIPCMFLIRHTLELGLKACIHDLQYWLDKKEKTVLSHTLVKLKEQLFTLIEPIQNKLKNFPDSNNVLTELSNFKNLLEKYVNDFEELDKTAQTFRYPFDTKGKRHFESLQLNERPYIKILAELEPFFLWTSAVMMDFEGKIKAR